jgi:Heparinase II/III-like protein/Heparinase II/III N-terminus
MKRAFWLARRLRSMSAAEISHRLAEQSRQFRDRIRKPLSIPLSSEITGPLAWSRPGFNLARARREASVVTEWQEIEQRVRTRRYAFLGATWPEPASGATDWHLDPHTGRRWPDRRFCFDIRYRYTRDFGDVKYVLEVNRLQHLQPLGALAHVRADLALARFCADEILAWINANPPYCGINWSSGIELALRAISILLVLSIIDRSVLSELELHRIDRSLAEHGYWLARYPSRYSSANNHLIAEALGLYSLGTLLPQAQAAANWREVGRSTLISEVDKQILPDGVGAEQSPTYTAFSVELFLVGGLLAKDCDDPFPDHYWARLHAAGHFLRALMDGEGNYPRFGDDDEGRCLFDRFADTNYVASVLAALAEAAKADALAPPRCTLGLRNLVLGMRTGNELSTPRIGHFPDGGYTVARTAPSGRELLLLVDHGPLGYLEIAAHGHADALALWLHIDGEPTLIDAGTFLYHGGGTWRDAFRGTRAHNTLSVAGASSSVSTGPFNWGAHAGVQVLEFAAEADVFHLEAVHDGFERRFGCRHARQFTLHHGQTLTIEDRLIGHAGTLPVEVSFLLAPDLYTSRSGDRWTLHRRGQAILSIAHAGPLEGFTERGNEKAKTGWFSPHFGARQETTRLVFSGPLRHEERVRFELRCHDVAIA